MIRLHYSNHLENLIAPLADSVAEHQRRDPLEALNIVVPSRVVEQFVKYRLAESLGVAANLKFPFLRTYLAEILEAADPNLKILDADQLQLVLFECLRSSAHRDDPELSAARNYIAAGSNTEADIELRTLMLAGELARIFREYSISRRQMIKRWSMIRRADLGAMTEMERWQRHLWQLVFDSHGRVRSEWMLDSEIRLMMLPDAFESIDPDRIRAAIPSTLHVFGSPYAGNAYSEIFARLGAASDLRIYALNPCREFWEDVDTSRRAALSGWSHRADKIGALIDESEDPFALNADSDSTALRLWGRPGREYIRMLNETTQCDFVPLFSNMATAGEVSLLATLQQNILDREPARPQIAPGMGAADDRSIRILACPGIRRESEIAANAILSTIRESEELALRKKSERIRFHEIAVMLPDSALDEYVAHIESVFSKNEIPIDLVNRKFSSTSRVAEAVELLIALPQSRFARGEVVRLLTHPALAGDSAIDLSAWPRWSEALGIFFGADDEDLKDTYIPSGLFHWDQGIKRLALGAIMSAQRDEAPRFYEAGDNNYLPFEVPQDQLASAARFVRDARSLIADALSMRDARLNPREWSRMLVEFVNAYIRPVSAIDQRVRDNFLEAIESMGESTLRVGPISYASAREMVAARIADFESRQGQFSGRGVAVGSLSSLRSIPFKTIFALGLNEGDFPARDRRDPMDLRTLKRSAGDVTPTERDRYLFLETLLAAREQIFLSYVARDPQTGDQLEPSSIIRELQFILRSFVDADTLKKMTIEHPVSEYDLKYFPDFADSPDPERNRELASFDPDARGGARMLALRKHLDKHAGHIALPEHGGLLKSLPAKVGNRIAHGLRIISPPESNATLSGRREEIWLPLSALRKFLLCPLQATARYALGMFDDDDDEETDDEPLEYSNLQKAIMLRDVFWQCGGDPAAVEKKYKDALSVAQMNGLAPVGTFANAAGIVHRRLINGWIEKAAGAGVGDLAQWQDIRIGRADESFQADRLVDPIALDVEVKRQGAAPYAQRVNLYGRVQNVSPKLDAVMQEVARKDLAAKHVLPLVMESIALCAAGEAVDPNFRVIIVGDVDGPAWVRKFAPMSREAARQYLSNLASELLSGGTNYFLPIEAVEDVVEAQRKDDDDLEEKVEKVRDAIDNEKHFCSSCSGPLRKTFAHGFEPPKLDELIAIIKERYAPIGGIFDPWSRPR
jgi:exodeoxyribonuclease V gamma subunit